MNNKELPRKRRYNKQRMKEKAKKIYPDWKESYKWADHLHGCSCYMCGNPRRKFKEITLQEKKHMKIFNEYKGELH